MNLRSRFCLSMLLIFLVQIVFSQEKNITGKVTDEDEIPLPGVNITVEGTSKGTNTDFDGEFEIEAEEGQTLKFSSVGFSDEAMVVDDESTMGVVMRSASSELDEVVVVGYGTQKKKNLTGAVDNVGSETFEKRSVANTTQALEGTIPNLNLDLEDGKPTRSAEYNIRGLTSIGQGGSALVLIDGVEGDPSLLNPNDIEDVSVLKDAAAASIYGARAAFGVVEITTKDPDKEKTTINYTGNVSVQSLVQRPDYVTNSAIWLEHFDKAFRNESDATPSSINNNTQAYSGDYLERVREWNASDGEPKTEVLENGDYEYYSNTDWIRDLFKSNAIAQDHNLMVSGGDKKMDYYLSGRLYDFGGMYELNPDTFKSQNIRGKASLEVTDWLKFSNNFEYAGNKYHMPFSSQAPSYSIQRYIEVNAFPSIPMYNPDGSYTRSGAGTLGAFEQGENYQDERSRQFRNTIAFEADFFDNQVHVRGDFTFRSTNENQFWKRTKVPYYTKEGQENPSFMGDRNGAIRETQEESFYTASNITADYQKRFNDIHNFKGMIGWNYETSNFDLSSTERNQLLFDEAESIALATGEDIKPGKTVENWKTAGAFFRINYDFKDRYLLEINGRYDGSSRFPSDEQWEFFPSVSAGWQIAEEPFWNIKKSFVSDLKIRASYGSLGNGNINPYQFQELLVISQLGRVLDGKLPQQATVPAPVPDGLTWETVTTANFGLDFGLLNEQLRFNGDYYIRKTTDMFVTGPSLPSIYGAEPPKGNYADLTTRGFELSLTWKDQFDVGGKPLNYQIKGSVSDNVSNIDKFNNPTKKLTDHYEGERIGDIWGFKTDGLFQEDPDPDEYKNTLFKSSSDGKWRAGDVKIQNLDESSDNRITKGENTVDKPGDQTIIGNSEPRYRFSLNLDFNWNGFGLTAMFDGLGKQDWYPGDESAFWGQYNRGYNQMPSWHLGNYWTEDNRDAYLPRYSQYNGALGWGGEINDRYLQNIAYVRLKSLQLSYDVPDSFISKTPLSSVRIFVTGENLWDWSPLYKHAKNFMDVKTATGDSDSDLSGNNQGSGNNYPTLRTLTLGLSITY